MVNTNQEEMALPIQSVIAMEDLLYNDASPALGSLINREMSFLLRIMIGVVP